MAKNIYVKNNIAAFRYDLPELNSKEKRCDAILIEFNSNGNTIWVIECKNTLSRRSVNEAMEQINKCVEAIKYINNCKIKKYIFCNKVKQESVILIKNKFKKEKVNYYKMDQQSSDVNIEIINAIKSINACEIK